MPILSRWFVASLEAAPVSLKRTNITFLFLLQRSGRMDSAADIIAMTPISRPKSESLIQQSQLSASKWDRLLLLIHLS